MLSIVNPLTTEAFQIRKPVIGFGFALPTPAPGPPPASMTVPQVQPQVISPLVSSLAKRWGYQPPFRRNPAAPYSPPVEPPPFYGMINFYNSSATDVPNRRVTGNINARLGYQTSGHCGRPYSELESSWVCPWGLDFTVDYDSSIFDSLFLQSEYLPFLNQIGAVPGLAVTTKINFGHSFLSENGTVRSNRRSSPMGWVPLFKSPQVPGKSRWPTSSPGIPGSKRSATRGTSSRSATPEHPTWRAQFRAKALPRLQVGALPQARLSLTAGEWLPGERTACDRILP